MSVPLSVPTTGSKIIVMIEIKAKLSPAEAGVWAELGNMYIYG
jgi:hypothetical protein